MASYEIIIKDQSKGNPTNPIASNKEETAIATNRSRKEASDSPWGYIAYRKVEPYIKTFVNREISMVGVATGRTELQQQLQFAADIGGQVVDTALNIAIGSKTGGVYGAIAGAVVSVAQRGINLWQKADKIRVESALERTSIGLLNVRSGGSLATYSQSRS